MSAMTRHGLHRAGEGRSIHRSNLVPTGQDSSALRLFTPHLAARSGAIADIVGVSLLLSELDTGLDVGLESLDTLFEELLLVVVRL